MEQEPLIFHCKYGFIFAKGYSNVNGIRLISVDSEGTYSSCHLRIRLFIGSYFHLRIILFRGSYFNSPEMTNKSSTAGNKFACPDEKPYAEGNKSIEFHDPVGLGQISNDRKPWLGD